MLLVCFRSPYSGGCEYYFAEIVTSSISSTNFVASLLLSLPVDLSAWASAWSSLTLHYCLLNSMNCLNSESESLPISESFKIVSTSLLLYNRFLFALIDYDARQQAIYWTPAFSPIKTDSVSKCAIKVSISLSHQSHCGDKHGLGHLLSVSVTVTGKRHTLYVTISTSGCDGWLQQRDCHGIHAVWTRRAARDCSEVDAKGVNRCVKKSITNPQPFVKKWQNVRSPRGGFFDSHCTVK